MVRNDTWFESHDGTKLFLRRWTSAAVQPAAVVHIAHGMAEHAGRYERLAEKLCPAGIEVWAADQRGHGKTADPALNGPGMGGLAGHCADKNGFGRVCADIHAINREIRKVRPDVPLFLMGHSWGSFILQNYIEEYPDFGINGCIFSGTRGPDGFRMKAGIPFMALIAAIRGQRRGSLLARAAADGPYNKSFRPNRTGFDWISRDEKVVDAFINDPLCGNLCSTGFYRDLVKGLYRTHRPDAMAKIHPNLAVYIFSGSDDPVGDMGASPTALVNAYRTLGIRDLEFVL